MDHAQEISANKLIEVVDATTKLLSRFKEGVNRLNVYPVPDGDTGTNLYLTLCSVMSELSLSKENERNLSACVRAISTGALMGARGNSGVIFSQIIRGFAEGVEQSNSEGNGFIAGIALGLAKGSTLADGSVHRPVEGTILTVARVTAVAAQEVTSLDSGEAVQILCQVARDALNETPNQLPVLKEANVVDAGGAGFVLFIEALAKVVDPEREEATFPWLADGFLPSVNSSPSESTSSYLDISGLRYEVMFLLEADDVSVAAFREVWAGIGDSIVVVGQGGIWNCHIHTDDIGAAIEAAVEAGRPKNIRVTDLADQVAEESWVVAAKGAGAPDPRGTSDQDSVTAVVVVANGDGIGRIFRSMGVNRIVIGGQSMNPSTADILGEIDGLEANNVIVLPNNSNIIQVAKIAAEMSSKEVQVLSTQGVIEGFAALMEFDPGADLEENVAAMERSMERVRTGELTQAVRKSTWADGEISEGDFLGIDRSGIVAVGQSPSKTAKQLLERLIAPQSEIVTIIEGEGSTPALTREISDWISSNWPVVEVEIHHGGQPLYPYLFGVE